MSKVLTISIAAYNVESFIGENLDSLLIPDIINDLEIFIVDDGGTDRTLEIAKGYEKQFPASFHVIHKENGGYGSTVNYSVEHATGRYFKLLDGDDWFDSQELRRLVEALKQEDSDVIVLPYYQGENSSSLKKQDVIDFFDNQSENIEEIDSFPLIGMWALVYRTEILRAIGLKLPEHMLYTDMMYSSIPFSQAKTIRYYPFGVYCYRIGRNEQSVSNNSRIKHTAEVLDIVENLCVFYEEQNHNKRYLSNRISGYYIWAFRTLLLHPVNYDNFRKMKEYERKINHISPEIYRTSTKIGKTGKMLLLFRKLLYLPYWLLCFIPKRFR